MPDRVRGPGAGTLSAMIGLLAVSLASLALWMPGWASWQAGALVAVGLAGAMGLFSLWAIRRAYRAEGQGAFVRVIFGTMLVRLVVAGLTAGLVIGFEWLHPAGFIAGMFGGLLAFQAIEIGGVITAARRAAATAEGATEHAG